MFYGGGKRVYESTDANPCMTDILEGYRINDMFIDAVELDIVLN
jgi:hypothetical protein